MELLKFLLGVSLIITAKTVTGEMSQSERVCRKNMQSLILIENVVILEPYFNENDYKNTSIYEEFKSYFDNERAKGNFIFHGETTMYFQLKNKLNTICLKHAQNLEIRKENILLYGTNGISQVPRSLLYDEKSQIVEVYFDNLEFSDTYIYRLVIGFGSSIANHTSGIVKTFYINNKNEEKLSIVAVDLQGTGIRQIFPCWDESGIWFKFTISIKHHRNYTALSNSPINWMQRPDNDKVWIVFEPTNNMATPYRVVIVLHELNRIPNTMWWCRQEVQDQIKFAIEMSKNITINLKRVFYNVKLSEVNHGVFPGFQNEGMESLGLILYREISIMYDEKLDPISWKLEVTRNLLRKIVHQFVDDILDKSWWSYLWLRESLPMFLTMEFINEYVSDLKDLFIVQFQHESLRLNDYYDMPLISEVVMPSDINSLFSFTYYVKAPVIVRTLLQRTFTRNYFSPGVFVREFNKYSVMYQDKPKNDSNSTIDEFFNFLQKIQKSLFNRALFNITERLSHWTKQKRYLILQVTRKSSENQVKIEKFLNEPYSNDLWVHVTYTTQNTTYVTKGVWMSPNQTIINIPDINDNEWIIVNTEQTGYYRVNYDKGNWRKLASYLNSSEYLNIHVLNRAQIIDDAYYFLLNKEIDFRLFRDLTSYLSKERNYIAWYPMFKIMEEISGFFPFSESTDVKKHFREILDSAIYLSTLKNLGYRTGVEEEVFTECLEQEIAKWTCTLNSPQCKTVNVYDPEWIYNMPIKEKPGRNEYINCNGMMTLNITTSNNVWNARMSNNKLLKFLACSENREIIIHHRLKNINALRIQIALFHSIIARNAKNDLVLNYLLKNFRNIIPSEIKMFVAITYIINHVYTEDQLIRVYESAKNNFSYLKLSYIYDHIIIRLAKIRKHIKYFNKFLKAN